MLAAFRSSYVKSDQERAQALVEFAMTVPLFLLLMVGIIDFSRMLFTYVNITNAAREMARAAAITSKSDAAVIQTFNNYLIIAGSTTANDKVCVYVGDLAAASTATSIGATCTGTGWTECDLPLTTAGCTLPSRSAKSEGFVVVYAKHEFQFNPVFGGATALAYGAFGLPRFSLETTTRAYLE